MEMRSTKTTKPQSVIHQLTHLMMDDMDSKEQDKKIEECLDNFDKIVDEYLKPRNN